MSLEHTKNYILLVDSFGKRTIGDLCMGHGPGCGKSVETEVQLLPGTLLREVSKEHITPSISTLYLKSLDQDDVFIFCTETEVQELSYFETNVLLPVSPVCERIRVYNDKQWLKEALIITKSSHVSVNLRDDEFVNGIVKYCGLVPELGRGIMFGIELMEHQELGVCDGTLKGKCYFQCPDNNGVFVAINRLRTSHPNTDCSTIGSGESSRSKQAGSTNSEGTPSRPQPLSLEVACSDGSPPPPLLLGDRVVWISDTGPEHGIVKWLGKLLDVGTDWMVGVEFDNPVGTGTGKYNDHQLFEAKLNHASLVPIIGLMKAEDFLGEKKHADQHFVGNFVDTPPKPRRKKKAGDQLSLLTHCEKVDLGNDCAVPTVSKSGLIKGSPVLARKSGGGSSLPNEVLSNESLDSIDVNSYYNVVAEDCSLGIAGCPSVNPLYEMLSDKGISLPSQKMGTLLEDGNDVHVCKKTTKINSHIDGNHSKLCSLDSKPDLEVGSVVEVLINGMPSYGVIQWIGEIPEVRGSHKLVAGIEMEEESSCCTDGTFNGRRYFQCPSRKAFFVLLSQCRKDGRFLESEKRKSAVFGSIDCPSVTGDVPPLTSPEEMRLLYGKNKGIQGHHNSCYLDATLFAMFSCTSVFDSLLHRPKNETDIIEYHEVQRVLKEEIVNPLRANFYVRADRVMQLRTLLEKLSSVRGLTCEEKDPEEFLNSLLNQILKAEPLLKLSSGQESYFYQLFVEKDEKLLLPTVQQLFDQSFLASDIKLSEVPPCLMIQMPRFGKQFKMYPRIIPSQYLDITDVLENSPRQCSICGQVAEFECKECFGQLGEGLDSTAFCQKCMDKSHSHKRRSRHKSTRLNIPIEYQMLKDHTSVPRIYMELFAVVCIETSHYVCFVKCGSGPDAPWCFFDSMADRKGEQNGYNIPEVVPFPDLRWWLSEEGGNFLLSAKDDKVLPEIARRLLCDAYMCMYQSPDIMMYR